MPALTTNGISIYYKIEGFGPPLLLISGIGQGVDFWEETLTHLTDYFQVVAFDNRGMGRSDMPDIPYTVEMMAADTLGLIAELGLKRPHLVGHSLGAAIAFEAARSQPDKVGRVVMASGLYPGPLVAMPSPEAMAALSDRSGDLRELARRGLQLATAPNFTQRYPHLSRQLIEAALNRTQPPHIYLRQTAAAVEYLKTDKLAESAAFQRPLCLIYGEYDQVAPPGNGERIRAKLPTAEFYVIPDAGHLLPIEQSAAFGALVGRFLVT